MCYSNGCFMKRGYLLLVFLSCVVMFLASVGFVGAQADDCRFTVGNACGTPWVPVGKVSDDGHFTSSLVGPELRTLCCRGVDIATGVYSFNYSNSGHVSFKSALTAFPNGMRLGFNDTCYLTNSACDNAIGGMCIFRVTNSGPNVADNSHIAECRSTDLSMNLCCRRTEVCGNGIDDDDDGYIDCADEDCKQSAVSKPEQCTGSLYTSDVCVQLTRNVAAGTNVTTYNASCLGQVPTGDASLPNYFYCSYSDITPGTGICCQSGTKADYNIVTGWSCIDSARCGLSPTPPCDFDFDDSTNSWLTNPYNGNINDWCVSRLPNLFTQDPPISERSTGCCLIVKDGQVDYYTDNGNVKIFGTS
jgi:hypothetical protein